MKATLLFVFIFVALVYSTKVQILGEYSAVIKGSLTSTNSDSEGRVIIGGNADLTNYGVGSKLDKDCDRNDLQVGGNLKVTNGECQKGKTTVWGNVDAKQWGTPCGQISKEKLSIDINETFDDLQEKSTEIGNHETTGTINKQYSTLYLTGSKDRNNYFNMESSFLDGVSGIHIDVPSGAWTFISIHGASVSMSNYQIFLSSSTNVRKILWNFPTTTTLTVQNLSIQGSILAPLANVSYTNGNIDGSIACLNFSGNGEFHNSLYISTCYCSCGIM